MCKQLGDFFQKILVFSEYLNFTYVLCCSLNVIQTTVLWFVRKCLSKVSFKLLGVEQRWLRLFHFLLSMFALIWAENNSTKVSYENPVMVFLKHEDYIADFKILPSQNNLRFQWLFHFILHLFIPFILTMKILEVGLIQQFSKHTVKAKHEKYPIIKNILYSSFALCYQILENVYVFIS